MQLGELFTYPVVLDGAWGTLMQAMGLGAGTCPDAWNLEYPERVELVGRAYVEAGSQVILTNTFGASRPALRRYGLGERVREVNRAGARASLQAADGRARVFASVGPTGKLRAMGEIGEDELRDAFMEQVQALAEEKIDGIVLETFGDLEEACLALAAAKTTGLPVVACMLFDSGKGRDRTMMGVLPERAAATLVTAGADAIGANCGSGIERFLPLCRRLRKATTLPLWLKPNAGLPKLIDGRPTYAASPEQFAASARALVEAGANFVGGCCGSTPAFIRALAQALGRAA
jgi:5-methyltetrahydrofolate--homocysteine methyltransferase